MTEEQVFLAALDFPETTARAAYLDETCGKDGNFRRQVEALLAAHLRSGEFLDVPAAEQLKPGSTEANTVTIQPDGAKNADEKSEALSFLTPSSRADSLGRIGHYEVLEILGRGGFGIVFRAFDDVLQRVVAVKMMAPQLATTSPARKRFLREARSSAQVRHENVVHVYEVVEHPLPYLVMEFIPGETLQQRLDRTGPLDVAEVLRIGRQIAEGLAAAHATDLIHRDIKPSNVLLESGAQRRAKITDFGLARAADDASISQSGIIAGTPMYMAPEQALGHKLDQRADLFSFGSVLYQMACGRPPFRANSTVAVLKRVAEDTPRPIREIIPEVPEWFCRIVEKLHAKDPDSRFQSAREVADVLADCETQLKTHGEVRNFARIPGGGKSPRKSKYRRFATSLCGVAALFWAVMLFGEPAYRYTANRAAIEVLPESGLTSVIVHRDGQAVTDWYDAKTRPTITLPPGKYKLEPTFAPGRTVERWELRTRSTFSSRTEWQGVRAPEFEVARGEQVTLRAVMRDEPAVTPIPPTVSDGFVPLFNGKDLTGWKTHPDQPGDWEVEGGILVGKNRQSYLFSDGKFDNFHLRIEAKLNNGGDTGIFFRTPFAMRRGRTADQLRPAGGYEVELQTNTPVPTPSGTVWDAETTGPPKLLGWAKPDPLTRAGEWVTLEVIVQGNRVISKVNGNQTADCIDPLHKSSVGHLALQVYSPQTYAQFRKIEIMQLPASVLPLPPTFKNSIGMEFVIVPKGKAWLGGGEDKLGGKEVVFPADFYLGKYEVTQEEWQKVTGKNPSAHSREGGGKDAVNGISDADLKRFPMENVSRDQCQIFADKLNKLEREPGWEYRLPTEEEWEYACRGGPMSDKRDSTFDFYFVKPTNTLLPAAANFNDGLKRTCTVGSYQPNVLGLYDMHGNVEEWCEGGELRGGGWAHPAPDCRAEKSWSPIDGFGNGYQGLRLARVRLGVPPPEVKSVPAAKQEPLPPTFENSIGMEFVLVPKGKSWLGGGKDKLGDKEVVIPADFYLGKFEVAQEEWEKVMGENPSHFSRDGDGLKAVKDVTDADLKRFPVESVTWDQCQVFVNKLNKLEKQRQSGWVYRLPTEAEWEYACRGGPMTNQADSAFDYCLARPTNTLLPKQANFKPNGLGRTCKVGSFEPNVLGLFDMHGNVEEWCGDPVWLIDLPLGAAIRGGNYDDPPAVSLNEVRHGGQPSQPRKNLGLRLARVPFGAPSPEAKTPPLAVAPFTDADVQRVAALPAAEQIEEVRKELMRRNPGFDGKLKHKIEDGVVTEFKIATNKVTDIAPIRVFKTLRVLDCSGTPTPGWQANSQLADLTPLKGMNLTGLTHLHLRWTKVDDAGMAYFNDCKNLVSLLLTGTQVGDTGLAPFKDCKDLTDLWLDGTKVSDAGLAYFKDCKKLSTLYLHVTEVSDAGLVHFKDCKDLTELWLGGTKVSDAGLAYFKDSKNLTKLRLTSTKVSDVGLANFKDCRNLTELFIDNTKISNLSLLKELPLKELRCDFRLERDGAILRSIKTLETINDKPANEFWKGVKDE